MIDLKLTEEQLDELHKEASGNPCPRARKRCWVVYLKGKGYAHREIADVVRVDEDTVTEYVRKYRDGGLPGLLAEHYRKGEGQLDAHAERLKKVFENRPPHTLNQGIDGLSARIQASLGRSPCDGTAYAFTNRRRSRLKLLVWDGTGVWLSQRRLHRGYFTWPSASDPVFALTAAQWRWLIAGVDWPRRDAPAPAHWQV
jgi:transposase